MPWFCHAAPKKKRSSKTRVSGVGKVRQDNNALSDDRPAFAVVLQSFASSIGDELTVQRGQVVEVMYHDGDWTFVRNLDSSSGYIPKMYCLSMDKVKGDFNNSMIMNHVTGPLPRPRVINVDTLQRSGSSVNSVEVHQVSSTTFLEPSDHTDTSTRTSSSSQVIYEVPKSPAQRFSGSASQSTAECVSEVTPPSTMRAPSLPPRSANLLTPAEIQRQQWATPPTGPAHRPAYLPGCRQGNPFTVAMQGAPQGVTATQQSPKLQRSGSYRSTAGQSPNSTSFHHRSGQHQQATPPAPPTPRSAPLMMTQPHTLHSAENSPSSAPASAKFSPGIPGTSPSFNLGRRYSSQRGMAVGRSHPQMRGQFPPMEASSNHVAATPGSAGAPLVAPSPISARFAVTPGSTPHAVTPGCATKPSIRLAAGASATDTNSQWPARCADSTPPMHNQHWQSRRFRRHSSDVVLLESCISEDSNVVTYHSPPQTVTRNHRSRQSHPCVTELGVRSPPRRPTRLPVRRSLSMQDSRKVVVTGDSRAESSGPIHRAQSYQEAVLTEEERRFGATASLKPSELVEQTATPGIDQSRDNRERSCDSQEKSRDRRPPTHDLEPAADPDDVFLPGTKKPFGIYKCTKAYQQKFKGEISLKKNELVIVLDQGRGEWAWAITSDSKEGLIPKSVLVQYRSDVGFAAFMGSLGRGGRGKPRLDAETQTERDACAGPDSSFVSCNDTDASCSVGGAATTTGGDVATNRGREEANSASAATTSSDAHYCPKEWFDTLDSVDAGKVVTRISEDVTLSEDPSTSHEQKNITPTFRNQGTGTTPTSSAQPSVEPAKVSKIPMRPKMKKAASVQHSERSVSCAVVGRPKSAKSGARSVPATPLSHDQGGLAASKIPVRPSLQAASVPQPRGGGASASSSSSRLPVKSGTVHYHDRISGIGSVNFETSPGTPSSTSHVANRPSPLLTAIKDYTPGDNSKNCLPLKRGDVLHLQPHMHYPKGWMWVWHTKRRSFGFVPKSYVAYTYDTPHRERKDTVEDAV